MGPLEKKRSLLKKTKINSWLNYQKQNQKYPDFIFGQADIGI